MLNPTSLDLVRVRSLAEALTLLAERPELRPLAGGTDVMPALSIGREAGRAFLDISRLDDLRNLTATTDGLEVGALVTYRRIAEDPRVREDWPNLAAAARLTGAATIQNRGTLGGNIAHASPAADSPPALLSYDARVVLASLSGRRELPLDSFFLAYRKTALLPGELVTGLRIPHRDGGLHHFRKVAGRRAQAIAKITIALWALSDGTSVTEIGSGFGAVGPTPLRARNLEADLLGRYLGELATYDPAPALARDLAPIDDMRSTAHYRARVATNVVRQFLEQLGQH